MTKALIVLSLILPLAGCGGCFGGGGTGGTSTGGGWCKMLSVPF